jgi:hypothetical protein
MKRIASLVGLAVAALLGGCAVYPDGTPMYGNGYGGGYYNGYDGYDGYATGVPVVPQTNVYMGYGNYWGPGYYGPGYYGPGPDYRGYPGYRDRGRDNGNRGDNGGWRGQPNGGGGPHGGPPPQGAAGGPGGPGGSNMGRPGPANPPPQQAGGGGGRGNGGNMEARRGVPGRQSGGMTDH